MTIRKFATISLLVLSSFAANNVAPSKVELEAMYDKAFREFNANNYAQALKELDAIDARQPDLAESQNLRGVIAMREARYDQAETALQKALAADPKFWNARFNLAEIPFLKKDWKEARNRFEGLLFGNKAELQGEALQLIQYKILLTYLMEGNENMVDSLRAKLELSPDTPASQYANAAISFQRKNEQEAKDLIAGAEKSFSPQLNKLFAESLYEIGWMQKPAGQTRAALELTSASERAAKTKAFARAKLDQAEQALQQQDLTAAKKLVNEADAADPNQTATLNLRGEILLAQKDFDAAENAFKQALKIDPKMHEAQFNLAQIPFKKKEYTKARERFETLFSATPAPGGDKNQAAQLIKFKIYLTLLLEGKDSRAQKMMEQFQFTGDTPALYYAQAAWEFKHSNPSKANDWVTSARKIYSPAMNAVFADAFYDIGWLQNQPSAPAPVVAEAGVEATPPIEPSPIPGAAALAANNSAKQPATVAQPKSTTASGTVPGMEATTANGDQPAVTIAQASPAAPQNSSTAPVAALSPSVETPVAKVSGEQPRTSAPTPAQAPAVVAQSSVAPPAPSVKPVAQPVVAQTGVSATPATVLAPATVREWSQPTFGERIERFVNARTLLVGALLLAALIIIAWVIVPEVRRRVTSVPVYRAPASATGPRFAGGVTVRDDAEAAAPSRLAGGPPKVSLQLRASEPSLRRAAVPFGMSPRGLGSGSATVTAPLDVVAEPPPPVVARAKDYSSFDDAEGVGEPVATLADAQAIEPGTAPDVIEEIAAPEPHTDAPSEEIAMERNVIAEPEPFAEVPAFIAPPEELEVASAQDFSSAVPIDEPAAVAETHVTPPVMETPAVDEFNAAPVETIEEIPATESTAPVFATEPPRQIETHSADAEPIGQGQPIPYQVPAFTAEPAAQEPEKTEERPSRLAAGLAAAASFAGLGSLRRSAAQPVAPQETIPTEPTAQQPTTPATMSQPMQPTQPTPAPTIRTAPQGTSQPSPASGGAPQAQPQPHTAGGMQTAVQLTFSFEIASLQLTPSFKMGALQLKPTSRIVTMRLAPSQQPQPAMNLQVTFEIANVQLAGNALGQIRLTPSQQQKPGVTGSPAFNVAGLQLLSGESGAVQLTPSQQGQASVQVTARFQIATVEFSPSFEIASLVLNSTSKSVLVQLPAAGQTAVEGAPVFDITNVQLGGSGEIAMMQLNPQGSAAPRPA